MKKIIITLIASTLLCASANAQQDAPINQREGESLQALGRRIIPRGMTLTHPLVAGDFGPGAGNIVVLFREEEFRGYSGWVLIPEGDAHRKIILPEVRFPVATTVRAVFFANADRDAERELLILCRHISGVGRYPGNITPFYNTYVYDWNGNGFTWLDGVTAYLDAGTVRGVRRQLPEAIRRAAR